VGGPVTHPAADRVTAEALVVEQNRSVVPLSTWVADAAAVAAGAGRLLQILTPADGVITYPLELLLRDGGGQWITRAGSRFRDGFTAAPMAWSGTRFVPVDGPVPEPAPDLGAGGLEVQVTCLHAATGELELGVTTAAVMAALTGTGPAGWGVAEPATQPWSGRELTAACRERAPVPTALAVVAGRGERRAAGRLHVSRVDHGVLEEARISGPGVRAVGAAAVERLADVLGGIVRSMIVAMHPTRVGGLRPARPSPPAVPYGLLVGASVVAQRGADHARRAPAGWVRPVAGGSACWCRFDGPAPFEQLMAVLAHFGIDPEPRRPSA
jgi:Family of unknown function (DUF6177)